ncbi:hypothetical protein JCM10908_003703 [Rhodotorula pacifica]|uniref:uncharacterized protein n=1 Tax=Rhodotorula pacifica TaxID=1495444 RepID=UPI0031729592
MSGFPPDRPRSSYGVDRPASHLRRRSSTSKLPHQTALLLQPDEERTPTRSPEPTRRKIVTGRWRISRVVVLAAVVLAGVVTLLSLATPKRQVEVAYETAAAPEPFEGAVRESSPPRLGDTRKSDPPALDIVAASADTKTNALNDAGEETRVTGAATSDDFARLPVCEKTVLFRFAGLHGFGSEVTLLYRVAAVARHYGYTILLDDAKWNYGSWSDYFLNLDLDPDASSPPRCRPPREGTKRAKMILSAEEMRHLSTPSEAFGEFVPKWATRPHVVWFSRDMDALDLTFLRLFTDSSELEQLRAKELDRPSMEAREKRPYLTPEETLPPTFERAFEVMSSIAGRAWRVTEEIEKGVAELARRIGAGDGVRTEEAQTDGSQAGDLVIAVHVRLGDKFLELNHFSSPLAPPISISADSPSSGSGADDTSTVPVPGLNDHLIAAYLAAAIDSDHSLLGVPSSEEPQWVGPPTEQETQAEQRGKPTLVLMSDDEGAVEAFRQHELARAFRVVGTSEVTSTTDGEDNGDGGGDGAAMSDGEAGERSSLERRGGRTPVPSGFVRLLCLPSLPLQLSFNLTHELTLTLAAATPQNETSFNSLPLLSRISSTRSFIRDLTFCARRADAIVMTGSSNVGRLLGMLFEAEGQRSGEEEEEEGGGPGRRRRRREMRSLDTRWFPTARYV